MALKINTKTDWGEMFDKFAELPKEEVATGPDPKHQDKLAEKAKDKKATPEKKSDK